MRLTTGEHYSLATYVSKIIFILTALWLTGLIVYRTQESSFIYVLTSWVLDYSAGFTRRGLTGALLNLVGDVETRLIIVNYIIKATYLLVVILYAYLTAKRVRDLNIATIMLVSPVLVVFPYNDPLALGRIEILGTLVTVVNAYIAHQCLARRKDFGWAVADKPHKFCIILALAAPAICMSILIFIHEGALLLALPINFMISFILIHNLQDGNSLVRSIGYTCLVYLLPIVCFAVIILFGNHGAEFTVNLCHNLRAVYGDHIYECDHDFFVFQSDTLLQNIKYTVGYVIHESPITYMIYGVLGIFCSIVTVLAVFMGTAGRSLSTDKYAGVVLYFFVMPFLATLPLYISGVDWARWFFAVNINFVLSFFLMKKTLEKDRIKLPFTKTVASLFPEKPAAVGISPSRQAALIILTIFFLGIKMPHTYPSIKSFTSALVGGICKIVF